MGWSVETHDDVDDEIEALPDGLRAKLMRLLAMIESYGLERMHEPNVKHLDGKLWELRMSASEGIARGIYVTLTGQRVLVLHVFEKKTQKTPRRAMDLALSRMKSRMT